MSAPSILNRIKYVMKLPYCILLSDGDYLVKIDNGKEIVVRLVKRIPEGVDERVGARMLTKKDLIGAKGFLLMDFGNRGEMIEVPVTEMMQDTPHGIVEAKILEDGSTQHFDESIYWNSEISRDRHGRFRYSIAEVTVPIYQNDDKHFDEALVALNRIIEVYRALTEDSYLERVREEDLMHFESKWESGGTGGNGPTTHKFREDIPVEANRLIRKVLENNVPLPIAYQFIADARNLIERDQYGMAVISVIIALENTLKVYVQERFEERKISRTLAKDMIEQLSMRFLIQRFVRSVEPTLFSPELVRKLIWANRKRNQIIHSASLQITKKEAADILESVDNAVAVLNSRSRQI